jgi:purine-nucleoside phosphorylase
MYIKRRINETVSYLQDRNNGGQPRVGIILGSGLGELVHHIQGATRIPFAEIPDFPVVNVQGHAGHLILGHIGSTPVVVLEGRPHFYEGHSMQDVVYPVVVMKQLGIKHLIISCAAGGVNPALQVGDLMIIKDHINLMGTNPLIGPNNPDYGPRFPDTSKVYCTAMATQAHNSAQKLGLHFREGVHCAVSGPCYETAAEIRFMQTIGADSVSMSIVPEAIAAAYLSLPVLAFACITNMATGLSQTQHEHAEVVRIAQQASKRFSQWVADIVSRLA